jgi:hypothetical protein
VEGMFVNILFGVKVKAVAGSDSLHRTAITWKREGS